jgi:hypothetical protein
MINIRIIFLKKKKKKKKKITKKKIKKRNRSFCVQSNDTSEISNIFIAKTRPRYRILYIVAVAVLCEIFVNLNSDFFHFKYLKNTNK